MEQSLLLAIGLTPHVARLRVALGLVRLSDGRLGDAAHDFLDALAFEPTNAEAARNLAGLRDRVGGAADAEQWKIHARQAEKRHDLAQTEIGWRRAVALQPEVATNLRAWGLALARLGWNEAAVAAFRREAVINPDDASVHGNLGVVLKLLGLFAAAEESMRRALAIDPAFAGFHNNLGSVLADAGRHDEAIACYDDALRLSPGFPDALYNRGVSLAALHRHDQAIALFDQAIAACPDDPNYLNARGASLAALGKTAEAVEAYDAALARAPWHAWAHCNRAQALLLQGEWERGFAEWEWRRRLPGGPARLWTRAEWDGSALPSGTLLLHAEQGLGDTLQFIRFARNARERVRRLVVECQPALVPLLSRCDFIDSVVPRGETLPDHDVHAALLSLPHIMKIHGESLGDGGPYLSADPNATARWQDRLSGVGGRRIGIVWHGNPKYRQNEVRSVPLSAFATIATVPGVSLVSLQRGEGRTHLLDPAKQAAFPLFDPGPDVDEAGGAFMDTAAIIRNLDLVIACDTAVAHLAGGLGVPVWLALHIAPDFRWLDRGDRSPWYRSMRLFRQTSPHDWQGVFQAMRSQLEATSP